MIDVEKLKDIIIALPKKKGTEEITSDILKTAFHVLKRKS